MLSSYWIWLDLLLIYVSGVSRTVTAILWLLCLTACQMTRENINQTFVIETLSWGAACELRDGADPPPVMKGMLGACVCHLLRGYWHFYHWQEINDKNDRLNLPSSTWPSQLNVTWPLVTCSNMIWNHADHKTWGTWELFTSRFFSRSLELAQLGSSGFTRSYMQACWAW